MRHGGLENQIELLEMKDTVTEKYSKQLMDGDGIRLDTAEELEN